MHRLTPQTTARHPTPSAMSLSKLNLNKPVLFVTDCEGDDWLLYRALCMFFGPHNVVIVRVLMKRKEAPNSLYFAKNELFGVRRDGLFPNRVYESGDTVIGEEKRVFECEQAVISAPTCGILSRLKDTLKFAVFVPGAYNARTSFDDCDAFPGTLLCVDRTSFFGGKAPGSIAELVGAEDYLRGDTEEYRRFVRVKRLMGLANIHPRAILVRNTQPDDETMDRLTGLWTAANENDAGIPVYLAALRDIARNHPIVGKKAAMLADDYHTNDLVDGPFGDLAVVGYLMALSLRLGVSHARCGRLAKTERGYFTVEEDPNGRVCIPNLSAEEVSVCLHSVRNHVLSCFGHEVE